MQQIIVVDTYKYKYGSLPGSPTNAQFIQNVSTPPSIELNQFVFTHIRQFLIITFYKISPKVGIIYILAIKGMFSSN